MSLASLASTHPRDKETKIAKDLCSFAYLQQQQRDDGEFYETYLRKNDM